jgi:hypothetical protein
VKLYAYFTSSGEFLWHNNRHHFGRRMLMRYLLGGVLLLTAFLAYADEPTAFGDDPSKPTPEIHITPAEQNQTPASSSSNAEWQSYDAPIRNCIQGDIIIPTKGNKILNYIFSNDTDTNATLSILGWKKDVCAINFSEGTLIKNCTFNRAALKILMDNLLNATLFDPNGKFAQTLSMACQSTVQN